MKKFHLAAAALLVVLPSLAATTEPSESRVKTLVAKLASEDPSERELATWGLEGDGVYFDDVPEMQKQLDAGDLSPEQRHRLAAALKYIKPRAEHWIARRKARQALEAARIKMMTEAYKKDGHTNPKWDAAVQSMFDLNLKRATSVSVPEVNGIVDQAAQAAKTAMDAGCDDPDFLAQAGLIFNDSRKVPVNLWDLFGRAQQQFNGNRVSPLARTIILGRVLRSEKLGYDGGITNATMPKVMAQLKDMTTTYQKMASDPSIDPAIVVETADNVWNTGRTIGVDQVALFRNVDPPLARQMPDDPTRLCIKGDYLVAWAYVARGKGTADTVTQQGWKDFAARINEAGKTYSAAYDADPLCSHASEMMVAIEMMRDNGRDEMEKWFERAMDAAEDPMLVVRRKALYLEPKWRGSPEEMVKFAHECMERDEGRTTVTMQPLNVHLQLAAMSPDTDGYLTDATVYADCSAACTLFLKRHPNDLSIRCWHAKLACLNEDWKTADAEFKKIGPTVGGNAFKSQAEADRLATKAARLAKDKE